MPQGPAVWAVVFWAGFIALVSLYYVYSLVGKLEEVKFRE